MLDLDSIELVNNIIQAVVEKQTLTTASESPYQTLEIQGDCSLIATHTAKELITEVQRLRGEVAWLNQVNEKLCASTTAEIQRLQGLVKDAYLEGYGQTGAWTRRESSWNDSEAKSKL
jgi:hypothetical protein